MRGGPAAFAAVVVALGACQEAAPTPDPVEAVPSESTEAGAPAAVAPPSTATCIRGGTTRAEVLAIMGEPDSVVFGAWMYGRSNITFGYGVVLDFASPDGTLIVC